MIASPESVEELRNAGEALMERMAKNQGTRRQRQRLKDAIDRVDSEHAEYEMLAGLDQTTINR